MVYENDRGIELIQAIADQWETTAADAVRRLVREKATELGIAAESASGAGGD